MGVLVVVPIEDVVAAVFDGPMATVNHEQTLGIGLSGRTVGDAIVQGEWYHTKAHRGGAS